MKKIELKNNIIKGTYADLLEKKTEKKLIQLGQKESIKKLLKDLEKKCKKNSNSQLNEK